MWGNTLSEQKKEHLIHFQQELALLLELFTTVNVSAFLAEPISYNCDEHKGREKLNRYLVVE